jgi:hypothetical protein
MSQAKPFLILGAIALAVLLAFVLVVVLGNDDRGNAADRKEHGAFPAALYKRLPKAARVPPEDIDSDCDSSTQQGAFEVDGACDLEIQPSDDDLRLLALTSNAEVEVSYEVENGDETVDVESTYQPGDPITVGIRKRTDPHEAVTVSLGCDGRCRVELAS